MQRFFVVVLVLSLLLIGCNRRQSQVPATHSYNLFGDRYFVDIETVGSFHVSSFVENREEGGQTVKELAEYTWGNNKLRIDMGKLTFNGKDCGTLARGDRVRVDKDGKLYVNGTRHPEADH